MNKSSWSTSEPAAVLMKIDGLAVEPVDWMLLIIEANPGPLPSWFMMTSLFGVICHDVSDPYFAAIAGGVMRVATDNGLLVMMASTFRDPEREVTYVSNLRGVSEADVQNGMEVALSIEDVDGVVLPQFRSVA